MKKLLSLLLSIVLVLALFTGCTTTDQPEGTNSTQPSAGSSDTTDKTDDTAQSNTDLSVSADQITSAEVDVLNVGLQMDVGDFNPWSFTGMGANNAIWGLYQPLLHFVGGQYYPSIMKSWEMSDDGLVLHGEIFDYIHDWEGNHYTASDVKFSLDSATEVWPEFKDILASVEVTGEYTFDLNFTRELYVGELETIIRVHIVSQKAYEDSPDQMHTTPVGSGPYKMTAYTSGYLITYEKVDDFWQTDNTQIFARDMANAKTVNFYIITEGAQRTIALEQGTIDFCSAVSVDDLEKFDGKNGYKLLNFPNNMSMTLFPNCGDSSPCSDLNLRLAICYAISNQAVLDSVYRGKGTLNYDIAPSWDVGYNEAWETEDNYYNYDAAKAADYLAQSSYNNEELVIMCVADEYSTNTAQLVSAFLEQIGIKSRVDSYESTVFNQYRQDPDKWDILLQTATANVFVAQANYSCFAKSRWASGGGVNFIYDDHFQELLNACMSDTESTQADLDALHAYEIENCYVMGLVNQASYAVVPDNLVSLTLSYRNLPIAGASIFSE